MSRHRGASYTKCRLALQSPIITTVLVLHIGRGRSACTILVFIFHPTGEALSIFRVVHGFDKLLVFPETQACSVGLNSAHFAQDEVTLSLF